MTRILYWNIEKFAMNKVNDPNVFAIQRGSALTKAAASLDRRRHILGVLRAADPDIIVVVEVASRPFAAPGGISLGAGMLGAIALLGFIRGAIRHRWSLVPPLQTGPHEAVAVFYRRRNRFFTGPWVWPGGMAAAVAPPGPAGGPRPYPGVQRNLLRTRVIPAGALQNVGVREYKCAARTIFRHRIGHVNAGLPIALAPRAPYEVSFHEVGGGGPRNLNIFAIHSPAALGPARTYLRDLADVGEIVDGLAAGDVRVVIGDFNVELLTGALAQDPAYAPLQAAGYTLGLRPVAAPPPAPAWDYRAYYATHIKARRHAAAWSTRRRASPYPGWGYVGSTVGPWSAAIDNAFIQGAVPANMTIMNSVVGSPMNVVAPAPGGAPVGTVVLARETAHPPPAIPPNPAPGYRNGVPRVFRAWANYTRLRSSSDHFALVVDV